MLSMKITRNQVMILISALIFGLFLRILWPPSDEPDFIVRVHTIYNSDFKEWSPYILTTEALKGALLELSCDVKTVIPGFYYNIDNISCSLPLSKIASRYFVFVLHILFIGLALSLLSQRSKSKGIFIGSQEHLNATFLTILMPSFLFYVSTFSFESWALVLSTLAILLIQRPVQYFLIVLYVGVFDSGNAMLLMSFWMFRYILKFILNKIGGKIAVFTMLSMLVALYFSGTFLIQNIGWISGFNSELAGLSAAYNTDRGIEIIKKYPLIVRPIITFLTFCFMTPAQIFSLPVTVLSGYFFVREVVASQWYVRTGFKLGDAFRREMYFEFYCSISFICAFIFILPGYSSAKYYLFLGPILIAPLIFRYGISNSYYFFAISNLLLCLLLLGSRI